ncbi:TetR/AcrR family transcriptional regulator [Pandoraea horticolens]|nr:TetR/AcrR family transcriptional regulator [Pandoraea horticolens]
MPAAPPVFTAVARNAAAEYGADVSMRDLARRAGVGLATLLRHFPTREALFEALLCTHLDALTQKADELETSTSADEALLVWFRELVAFAQSYKGVIAMMAAAHANPDSALYAACAAVHESGARLLLRAQGEGTARADMNGDDLFALITALGWAIDQPSFAPRADQLVHLITSAILTNPSSHDAKKATS